MYHKIDNTVVLFVDLINDFDFPGGENLLKHTTEILPNLIRLKEYAKKKEIPIIYVNDHYGLWQADFNKIIRYCLNKNSEEIIQKMKPDEDDYFFIKPQHSAFFQTPLQALLTELNRDFLVIAGIAGDICILFTAKDAYMYQMGLHIPNNCLASEEIVSNQQAINLMQSVMKADISPIE